MLIFFEFVVKMLMINIIIFLATIVIIYTFIKFRFIEFYIEKKIRFFSEK